jgi:glutathione S-transferase
VAALCRGFGDAASDAEAVRRPVGQGRCAALAEDRSEIANHLGHVAGTLAKGPWLFGEELTGADVQMSFVGGMAGRFGRLATSPPGANRIAD